MCVCVCTYILGYICTFSVIFANRVFLPLAAVSPPFAINNKLVNDIPTNDNGAKSAIFDSVVSVGTWVCERHVFMYVSESLYICV